MGIWVGTEQPGGPQGHAAPITDLTPEPRHPWVAPSYPPPSPPLALPGWLQRADFGYQIASGSQKSEETTPGAAEPGVPQ